MNSVFLFNFQSCAPLSSNKKNLVASNPSNNSASTIQPRPIAARPPVAVTPPTSPVVTPAPVPAVPPVVSAPVTTPPPATAPAPAPRPPVATAPIATPPPVVLAPPPVVAEPEPAPSGSGLDMQPDPWTITPAVVTNAAGGFSYYSDKITVTGLSPAVKVYVTASKTGFVDANVKLTGTYGTATEVFVVDADGSIELKVQGHASYTPGETIVVYVSVRTFAGYGSTFESGTVSSSTFSVTTKP